MSPSISRSAEGERLGDARSERGLARREVQPVHGGAFGGAEIRAPVRSVVEAAGEGARQGSRTARCLAAETIPGCDLDHQERALIVERDRERDGLAGADHLRHAIDRRAAPSPRKPNLCEHLRHCIGRRPRAPAAGGPSREQDAGALEPLQR